MVYMIYFVVGEVLLLIGQTHDVVHRSSRGCMLYWFELLLLLLLLLVYWL